MDHIIGVLQVIRPPDLAEGVEQPVGVQEVLPQNEIAALNIPPIPAEDIVQPNRHNPVIPICMICMDREVNRLLLPCGHCFCAACANAIVRCGICRHDIAQRHPIFL